MLTPWRIELANLPSESESGTQKKPSQNRKEIRQILSYEKDTDNP